MYGPLVSAQTLTPKKIFKKCGKKFEKTEKFKKKQLFSFIFGFCGFSPWRRLSGNFWHTPRENSGLAGRFKPFLKKIYSRRFIGAFSGKDGRFFQFFFRFLQKSAKRLKIRESDLHVFWRVCQGLSPCFEILKIRQQIAEKIRKQFLAKKRPIFISGFSLSRIGGFCPNFYWRCLGT